MRAPQTVHANRLHDDTEEDLVGADWHQDSIRSSVLGLKDLATLDELPWHVGDQLTLVCTKPDRSPWRPMPDVMLHARAGAAERAEMSVRADGVPELIIEVASPTTRAYDVDTHTGKAWGYLHLGVVNYLVFDPDGSLLGEQCRGWQLRAGKVQSWFPAADGRYHTIGLGISFRPDGNRLRIFDREGQPVPFSHEKTQRLRTQEDMLRRQEQALRHQEWEAREQTRRIAELEAELARLRGQD
ncbi:MAG: Uma2 family endonuclease [Chloroflexota bacterium]